MQNGLNNIDLEPKVEVNLLKSFASTPVISIYDEENPEGMKALENCKTPDKCVSYLLDKRGLGLKDKISEQIAKNLLVNYCCIKCQRV